ncbi:MAG: DUF1705 domain-containing protein, partial [Oscillospiraceae bacterium]|nr:DUF1705 domain-containing protein [Oscillospiraceae bacterium]
LFVGNGVTLYFINSYNVIIDRSMMGNVFNTRFSEASDPCRAVKSKCPPPKGGHIISYYAAAPTACDPAAQWCRGSVSPGLHFGSSAAYG